MRQVDQEEAFDKIDWNFLFKKMTKIEISFIFKGLRRWCPLSFSLYAIQGDVITTNINKNNLMKNIHIPNRTKETKNSQYADDSNFFLKIQESVVLKF